MLSGKTIVVTGCLQGIGRQTMTAFAENGADVIACAYKEDEEFDNYCKELSKRCDVVISPMYCDMSDNDDVKNTGKKILAMKKDIHGIVNIAGINKDVLFNMINYQNLFDTFQVNFFSQIMLTHPIVRWMQRRKIEGSVVFTSSSTALFGVEGQTSYGASKAALIGAMRSMAIELGRKGIRVNAVAPGVIRTPMIESVSEELTRERINMMDIPHIGDASDVANIYMFLMSDLSRHITGQVLRVDGGM